MLWFGRPVSAANKSGSHTVVTYRASHLSALAASLVRRGAGPA